MLHVVQFSGGKDSTALVLWAKEQEWPFTAVFCDTGWEHPLTCAYVQHINDTQLNGALVTVKSAKYPGGMIELVTRKGRVPSARARFCTEELKVFPFRDWLVQQDDAATIYQGIRAEESRARRDAGPSLWSDVYDSRIERPLYNWTADDVFAIHKKYRVKPNALYTMGAARVGCFPCVMVNHGELRRLTDAAPEIWERAASLERAATRSFFPPAYIPARFCSQTDPTSGTRFPTVADVRAYLLTIDEAQIRMFDRCSGSGCLSIYNLCE